VQRRAVEELVRMHKKAMPEVQAALKNENPNVRIGCADFLSKVRRMESLTALAELVNDPDQKVRLKAIGSVSALSQVWKGKAVEFLTQALAGTDPACVKKAATGLRDMEYDKATEVLQAAFEGGQGIQSIYAAELLYEMEPSPKTARPILQGLLSEDKGIRDAARECAMDLKDRVVAPLVEFIDTQERTGLAIKQLNELRDEMIKELDVILDSQRAADILTALGTIADKESIAKLNKDLNDAKLESAWRVAAARGLAVAALSSRTQPQQRAAINKDLASVMNNDSEDDRVRIGAAIALCQLKEAEAVQYLLGKLESSEEAIRKGDVSQAKRNDLIALRIRAQEALTQAGDFVVPFLMKKLRSAQPPGDIIVWAAAKTLGELRVDEVVPFLGKYLTSGKKPRIPLSDDGHLSGDADSADWQALPEADAAKVREEIELFEYPHYVRWTCAIALGQVGGQRAGDLVKEAERAESEFLARLRKLAARKDHHRRANVIDPLMTRHEDVLFYIRQAGERLVQAG
jgi:HEAT repeat protein